MLEEIFPITYWKARVENFDAVQAEIKRAVDAAEWNYYLEEKDKWGKSQKFSAPNPFSNDLISKYEMYTLQKEIMTAVSVLDPNYELNEFSRPTSWITRYDEDDYAHIHSHYPAVISGAYYYNVAEQDNNSFFFECAVTGKREHIQSEDGLLVVFPGHLKHGVNKILTDGRIVLSFNLHN
jgi:hypothetical protein